MKYSKASKPGRQLKTEERKQIGMRKDCFSRQPKNEEQEVPETINGEEFFTVHHQVEEENGINVMDEFEGIQCEETLPDGGKSLHRNNYVDWDSMDWNGFSQHNENSAGGSETVENSGLCFQGDNGHHHTIKSENLEFWDDDLKISLNLSLNYQDVLDTWCNRKSLWAEDCSFSMTANSNNYMGEVPVMEEERSTRREASLLRYKEKRQNRLFSKRIRYQVRKLNADKRPRLKGRFVKRGPGEDQQ